MSGFSGAGWEQKHGTTLTADSDHPAVVCSSDTGPTPVEKLTEIVKQSQALPRNPQALPAGGPRHRRIRDRSSDR